MGKETDGIRIIEHHVIPDENGWVKLPARLLQVIGVTPGDMLSFIADENGFRVTATKKPPYFHASLNRTPPSTLQAPVPETYTEPLAYTLAPQQEEPTPPTSFTDATQRHRQNSCLFILT